MKHIILILSLSVFFTSCRVDNSESKYYYGNYTIIRQDWNDCMTKLSFFDKQGDEIGSTLEYYPGRDGWFLIDVVFDDNCVYLSFCDCCPKIIIKDSSQFIINPHSFNIPISKERWRRISSSDEAPVVKSTNIEYGSKVTKSFIRESKSKMPDWNRFPGRYCD